MGLRRFCVAGVGQCALPGRRMYALASLWRPFSSAAFAWQAWDNVHCQGVSGVPWSPPLLRDRRGAMYTPRGSDVRPWRPSGVPPAPSAFAWQPCRQFALAGGRMYAMASHWRPLGSAAFAWQACDNLHCQGVGCPSWRPSGVPWSPPLLRGRRGTMCTPRGSDVRPGVPLASLGLRRFCVAGLGQSALPGLLMWQAWANVLCQGVSGVPWAPPLLRGRRGAISIAKGSDVRLWRPSGVPWSPPLLRGRLWDNVHCQVVGCSPWRPSGVPWAPPLLILRGRRGKMRTARGNVRFGVPLASPELRRRGAISIAKGSNVRPGVPGVPGVPWAPPVHSHSSLTHTHWLTHTRHSHSSLTHTHTHTHSHTHSLTHSLSHARTHASTHALTHTHSHSLTLTHTHSHSLTLTHTHSHSLTHTHSHSLTLTHTHSHSLTLTHTHSHSLTHSHSHSLTLTHTHSHSLTLTHTHSHSLTLTHTHSHSLTLTHTHSHSLTLTHTHSHSLTLTHTHSHSLTLTHTHPHSLTLTHTHPHSLTLTHSHSLSPTLTHSLTHALARSLSLTDKLPLTPGTHIVNTLPKWHTCTCTYIYIHTNSPTITPPSLSYFLFPCCFSVLSLSLEKLLTCGVLRSYNLFINFPSSKKQRWHGLNHVKWTKVMHHRHPEACH